LRKHVLDRHVVRSGCEKGVLWRSRKVKEATVPENTIGPSGSTSWRNTRSRWWQAGRASKRSKAHVRERQLAWSRSWSC
jgi:hypothetical protein